MIRALREQRTDFKSASVALHHLYDRLGPPSSGWADARVYFHGNRIYAEQQDEWDVTAATQGGQKVETQVFGNLFEELRLRDLEEGASVIVPPEFRKYVEIDPDVMSGEPVVRGTRIPTAVLAALKRTGKSVAQLAKMYGSVSTRTIQRALAYEQYLDASA